MDNQEKKIADCTITKDGWIVTIRFKYDDGSVDHWPYHLGLETFKEALDKGLSTMNWKYFFELPDNL